MCLRWPLEAIHVGVDGEPPAMAENMIFPPMILLPCFQEVCLGFINLS